MSIQSDLFQKKAEMRDKLRPGLHISRQYERGLRSQPQPSTARDLVVRMPHAAKLSPERSDLICESLRLGAHPTTAAMNAGINPMTLSTWVKRGRMDREAGEPSPYVMLVEAMEKATAEAEVSALQNIHDAAEDPKFWQANTWLLERRFAKHWKRVEQVQMTGGDGGPVKHQVAVLMVDADKLRQARALTDGVIGVQEHEAGEVDLDDDVIEGDFSAS